VKRRLQLATVALGLLSLGAITLPAVVRPVAPPAPALMSLDGPGPAPSPRQLAAAAYSRMTPAQRVGQLFMAGVPSTGATAAQLTMLQRSRVGNVILITDTTESHRAVKAVTTSLAGHQTETGVAPFISTDQEGGEVQRLTGKGFSAMPTALKQGTMRASALRAASTMWGSQLASAGVSLDLAPVADTVPAKHAKRNLPIGAFDREFGHTPTLVAHHVVAFIRGMHTSGVDTTVKHFPGLGRATGNTDTTRHVTDPTGPHSSYLMPFQAGIKAGTQFVMVSSATYPNIDPGHLACFSPVVITSLLRGDLHFKGVVISDDLGTVALSKIPLATRAVRFFNAGGTMLIDTTLDQVPAMVRGVMAEMAASTSFAVKIQAAAMNVLVAKATANLIGQ
jgi:beta-N-acetylhexosaminidase